MTGGAQGCIEGKREAHERVQEPSPIKPSGGEPERIGDDHRDHRSGQHVPERSQPGRDERAGEAAHGCSGNGHAELRGEHADEHGPRAPGRHKGDWNVRQDRAPCNGCKAPRSGYSTIDRYQQNRARTRNFIAKRELSPGRSAFRCSLRFSSAYPSIRARVTPSKPAIALRAALDFLVTMASKTAVCSAIDALKTSARRAFSRNCASRVRSISV